MSSTLCSQGMVLATAMAVSGTVILLALRLQKSLPPHSFLPMQPQHSSHQQQVLRSCISSEGKKKMKKRKKRVQFAEDVVDPIRDGKEFRRQSQAIIDLAKRPSSSSSPTSDGDKTRGMPANRVALYNGILRDRVSHRLAYSS